MKECQHCKKCYTDDVNICPSDGMPTLHTISGEPILEGKYHLEKRLGQGGMGVVYCAKHAYLKTQHAIKVILPDLVGNDPQLVTRFRQEALAAAAIRHHNVVSTTDYGVAQGTMPFLVMEYVEGESLHDLMTREGRIAPEKALELITAICAGIGVAHQQGIVHRDLKPLNIMICKDKATLSEAVKILDFGLAKIKSGELLGSFIQAQTTGLMGSPYYMAPEQWSDEDLDGRSDIYSLGVMLFQMLTGDVPFKGSSIPAIMKKHLYDQPPNFADLGINLPPQLELAVRHTLEKDPKKRTATVDIMVGELRNALGIAQHQTGAFTGMNVVVSSLSVLTKPPKSEVFINNVAVGQSKPDGLLFLEGIQSGNHHLRVSHNGFEDWEDEILCDGKPRQVVAELRVAPQKDTNAIPKPQAMTIAPLTESSFGNQPYLAETKASQSNPYQTFQQPNYQTGQGEVFSTAENKKKSSFSPLILGIIGISSLLLLVIIGVGGAFWLGFIGKKNEVGGTTPTPSNSPILTTVKSEMAKISGGTYKMGRSDGDVKERPEHNVTVKDFWMDKTEVTNEEYAGFVAENNHPAPNHWVNGKPVPGTEKVPVRFVSFDDAETFAKWRSKRDGVTYRLPSEEEWEYAARNGDKNNLYPWGDKWTDGNAVMNVSDSEPTIVGSRTQGKNIWGIEDLIGNVWEWTSTEINAYPGSSAQVQKTAEKRIVVRGGSAHENPAKLNITSTFRADVSIKQKEKNLGFRLVRSD